MKSCLEILLDIISEDDGGPTVQADIAQASDRIPQGKTKKLKKRKIKVITDENN